jgi:hypothetical protein
MYLKGGIASDNQMATLLAIIFTNNIFLFS